MVYPYMVPIYAFLVKAGSRTIEQLPNAYQLPVAEFLVTEAEAENDEAG